MGAVRGVLVGSAGLVALYNVVAAGSNPKGLAGLDTLAGIPGGIARYIISPDVPLIPDLRTGDNVQDPAPPPAAPGAPAPAPGGSSGGSSGGAKPASLNSSSSLLDAARALSDGSTGRGAVAV